VDLVDLELRNATYGLFVELGRAPTLDEVGAAVGQPPAVVKKGWGRLHEAHALVLDPSNSAIRMASPFSGVPTSLRVEARGRSWYANCAWDAFGICAALDVDGRIETSCPDCGEPIGVDVRGGRPNDDTLLFHCVVPRRDGGTTSPSPEAR
jgi:Alkylmercury lyase